MRSLLHSKFAISGLKLACSLVLLANDFLVASCSNNLQCVHISPPLMVYNQISEGLHSDGVAPSMQIPELSAAKTSHTAGVVLEVMHFAFEKHIQPIETAIKEVSPSSKIVFVCTTRSWIGLEMDLSELADVKALEAALRPTGLVFYIKTDAALKQVMESCGSEIVKY